MMKFGTSTKRPRDKYSRSVWRKIGKSERHRINRGIRNLINK